MELSEKVKDLCKENGITVAKLEQDCGFANGYISRIKVSSIPADRLHRIEQYFNIPPYSLIDSESLRVLYQLNETFQREANEENAKIVKILDNNPELRLLFDLAKDSSPEDVNLIYQVLLALKRKERMQKYADGLKAATSKEDK